MGLIYHITYATEWDKALAAGSYTMSTRGVTLAEQGFIHASTAAQVAGTASRFYAGEPGLIVLEIDEDLVEPEIKYEPAPGTDELFPHIYGPLNTGAVVHTRPLAPPPTRESGV
ncbi:DUF952 domain-containing protein [Pseudonocardia spinosispora]|uniref:DUF952 domain-containing protein n=1 Tax=Pseudonocardia spinosispora TaxID=103441 RepID=UPI00040C49A5|nr:DUF952 domain-containing protein [Pseudonocardia spinosispora]